MRLFPVCSKRLWDCVCSFGNFEGIFLHFILNFKGQSALGGWGCYKRREERQIKCFTQETDCKQRDNFVEELFFQPHRIIASEMQSYFGPAQL